MEKIIPLLLIICLVQIDPLCHAQTSVTVSDPRIELKGNTVHIFYDILESESSDKFIVSIDITDKEGNNIDARALEGDIGKDVTSGDNKHITWDLEVDKIYLNTQIFFEIHATLVPRPEPVVVQPEKETPISDVSQSYSRADIILQSIALPGMGMSRLTGKPHWIRSVAGYGCIAGSIILYQQARNSYNSVEDYPSFEDKRDLYETSIRQDNFSEVLAYAAIGIWVTDIIWTVIGTSDLNKKSLAGKGKGISFWSSLDPISYSPTVGIRLRF